MMPLNSSDLPQLSLVIEPENKFRFRYASESGSHGVILGKKNANVPGKGKKVYPTVKLENYHSNEPIFIRASLCTEDREPHILELFGKHIQEDGMCYVDLHDKDFTAKFSNLVIRNKKKEDAHKILMERKIRSLGSSLSAAAKRKLEKSFESEIKEKAKEILSSAVLCFEAFTHDNPDEPICEPIYSESICNQKSSLRIHRMSRCSGSWKGNDEVILLCDKVKKDAIKVLFFERDDNDSIVWEGEGDFTAADVHHQVAITFKTPKYREDAERSVFVCLSQNDEKSDSIDFLYTAGDLMSPSRKRKRSKSTELENSRMLNLLRLSTSSSSNDASSDNQISDIPILLKNDNRQFWPDLNAAQYPNTFQEPSSDDFMSNVSVPLPNENSPSLYLPESVPVQSTIIEQESGINNIANDSITDAIKRLNCEYESNEEVVNIFLNMDDTSFASLFEDIPILDSDTDTVDFPHTTMQTDSTGHTRPFDVLECSNLSKNGYGLLPQSMLEMSIKDEYLPTKKRFHDFNHDTICGQMEETTYSDTSPINKNLKQMSTEKMTKENKNNECHFSSGQIVAQMAGSQTAVGEMAAFKIVCSTEKETKEVERSGSDSSDKLKARQVCSQLLSKTDTMGSTLLHLAVLHKKDVKSILKMIKFAQTDILNAQNHNKQTAIHLATEQNNAQIVKLLCLNGANPNVKNSIGDTCFHVAVRNNSISSLRILMCHASGIDAFNYEGLTPLHITVMKKPSKNDVLNVECLTLLLDMDDINVNVCDKKAGRTPLHYAVEMQSPFISDLLRQPYIDVNSQDFSGDTPLHVACTLGYLSIAKLLLENGADSSIRNYKQSYSVSDEESSEDESDDYPTTEISTDTLENTYENAMIIGQTPMDVCTDKKIIKLLTESIQGRGINTKDMHSDDSHKDADQSLQSVEEKMCLSLDDHLNMADWSNVIMCLGLEDYVIDNISKCSSSPANALIQNYLKREYKENYIEILQNAFEMAGLQKALKIVKEIHSS